MIFASPVFIYLFLPFTLILYYLAERTGRIAVKNSVLLFCSLIFYSWGGIGYLVLLLVTVVVNYSCALAMERSKRHRTALFVLGLIYDLGLLFVFKYVNFLLDSFRVIMEAASHGAMTLPAFPRLPFPIGISFFTFQILSYFIDVYRRKTEAQKSIRDLALYIMLFPQLIAGPIVRYLDVKRELGGRVSTVDSVYSGVCRFMMGFLKKILLANTIGEAADAIFAGGPGAGMVYVWMGAFFYSLQIYLDFSAYSDMAIGMGDMFGFHFPENFNYPYCSGSMREFWTRWHMTLNGWFVDYVYIPLGGSRKGAVMTYRNLFLIFVLSGLWHGAAWTFFCWGLFHACLVVLEKWKLGRLLERLPDWIRRVYIWIAMMVGMIFFRADTIGQAVGYLKDMVSFQLFQTHDRWPLELVTTGEFLAYLAAALVICSPALKNYYYRKRGSAAGMAMDAILLLLFVYACGEMMAGSFNPFIYFRF